MNESINNMNICNFCLTLSNSCSSVDESVKRSLELIFTTDLMIPECSLICEECRQKVCSAFDLRSASIHNEDFIAKYETDKPGPDKLIGVCLDKHHINNLPKDLKICRLCVTIVHHDDYRMLDCVEIDMNVRDLITEHLPEVNLNLTNNPIVCKKCLKQLKNYGMLTENWLDVIKVKKLYCQSNNTTDISDLNDVRKFISENNISVKHSNINNINSIIKIEVSAMNRLEIEAFENEGITDCATDNTQFKEDIEDHKLKFVVEGVLIKTELVCSDVQLKTDDSEIAESKHKIEQLPFEPNTELDNNAVKEDKEICIYDVKNETDSNAYAEYSESVIDSSLYHGHQQQNNNACEEQQEDVPDIPDRVHVGDIQEALQSKFSTAEIYPEKEQKRCSLQWKTKQVSTEYSGYQFKLSNEFRQGICSFQNNLETDAKAHVDSNSREYNINDQSHNGKNYINASSKLNSDNNSAIHEDEFMPKFFKCLYCIFQSKTRRAYIRHLSQHHAVPFFYECEHCSFRTKYRNSYKDHTMLHRNPDEIELFKCEHCDFTTKHKKYFRKHLKAHFEVYQCKLCNFHTKYLRSLRFHQIRHQNPDETEIFKCERCDYTSTQKRYLHRHSKTHCDVYVYQCELCNFHTNDSYAFKIHKIRHQSPDEMELFKCSHCDFKTKYKNSLKMHSVKHSDESNIYECEHCDFKTKYKNYFKNHSLTHSTDFNFYQCTLCDFKSKYKRSLQIHLRGHSNDGYLYECTLCDYKTNYKHNLNVHSNTHSDKVQTHQCTFCNFHTKHFNSYQRHQIRHRNPDEIELFKCSLCDFETKHKQSLRTHSKRHSNESDLYECEHCDYKTIYKHSLAVHSKVHSDRGGHLSM